MLVTEIINPNESIWRTNPLLETITALKEFKKREGVRGSSKILTAIFLIWDPKSKLYDSGLSEDQIMEDINRNVLGEVNFEWDQYEDIKNLFLDINTSVLEKRLVEYERQLKERDEFFNALPWNTSNAKLKDSMMSNNKKLWEEYLEVKRKVEDERSATGALRANYEMSLAEEAMLSNGK